MADLHFEINDAEAPAHSASPQLVFKLETHNMPPGERIHSGMLQCQVRFEAPKRSYDAEEQDQLRELFGAPEQWGRSLKSLHWTDVSVTVPSFTDRTVVDLPVACSYDLHVTGTKYFYALNKGKVPLLFLFSGTFFYEGPGGKLQVQQVARTKECSYRMPVERWKEMIENHYSNTAWLYLRKDVFERLYAYKRRHALPTWEQTVEHLLPEEPEAETSPNGKSEKITL